MYRNAYQRGMLTIFFSGGAKPLQIWDTRMQDGYITRFLDQDIKSMVLEIGGTNVSTTYMICPKGNTVLGITMPFLIMVVKNLKKYFSFEVTILDETGTRRRFRVSNFQSTTQILPLCTVMPICLSDGWNQIQFNLAEFTRRAYKKQFVEVQKLKINANIRLRRIYFAERLLPEDQLPPEYKLYFPLSHKDKLKKAEEAAKEKEITIVPTAAIEEKKEEQLEPARMTSKAEVARAGSKASVHSIRKVSSKQSSQAKVEGDAALGSKRASVVATPVEASGEEVVNPTESEVGEVGEAAEGETPIAEAATEDGEPAPAPDGEPPSEAPLENAPEDKAQEEAPVPAPEESPPQPEEPATEPPQAEEPAPEAPPE